MPSVPGGGAPQTAAAYGQLAGAAARPAPRRRLYLPTFAVAVVAAGLAWDGWRVLSQFGLVRSIHSAQLELAGPAVVGFVLVVFVLEQVRPAERHATLARGHVLDMTYLLAYALVVVPLIALIGTGFSGELGAVAPWLVIPRVAAVPQWAFIAAAVVAIDAVAHLGNHRINSLWRLHAVHHSQEELSILTTFRAHPLVHVSFLISAPPVLALSANNATPAAVLTVYACLGALPHANVRWSYGVAGSVLISPAYHRIHHSATGRLDINLGTVLTIWDRMSRRAVFPARGRPAGKTGLAGRPVPVEQSAGWPLLARIFVTQWAEPFTTSEVPDQ